ncbi:MAG TPA: TolC family protein [Bryobacteraceae bacterium]|nr:TolC family protein [Bryobacteraceae bacterium]
MLKPFHLEKRAVSAPKLSNSPRLQSLVRDGKLYLSVDDAIALVLENNLDIAVQRYSPLLAREVVRRTEGGGLLRQIDTPVISGPTSVSTTGVSLNANGLAGGAGIGSGGGVVSSIGPNPPNLDPNLSAVAQFGHTTTPQTNTLLNQTAALISDYRYLQFGYSQAFTTGTYLQFTAVSFHNLLNSVVPLYNPALTESLDLQVSQNLLQGLNRSVNDRYIRVAKNNEKVSDLQLKLQIATTVSAVLNLYWDLVAFHDAVRIKEEALKTAQDLYEGNKKQVAIGALPAVEVTRAAAEVSASKEDLLFAQTNVDQQEIVLKNALSRNAMENAWLDDVHVVPLDRIEVPKSEEIRPVQDLIGEAMANRLEIARSKIDLQSRQILARGDRNGLLPSLQAFAELTNHALSGPANPRASGCSFCAAPDAFFIGGGGNALAQLFQRNFPDYSAGFSLTIPIRNRSAQADYVTDLLQLRQTELQLQRAENQVRVDVKTAVIGLQQARARYQAAVDARGLAEQSLANEQRKFQFGVSTVPLVIQAQKDLATDQDAEVQALANYTHARIAFDLALGRTLDANHISMAEASDGRVERQSVIPDSTLQEKTK